METRDTAFEEADTELQGEKEALEGEIEPLMDTLNDPEADTGAKDEAST